MRPSITLIDGPVGTELAARGVPTPLPGWSVHALRDHPEAVRAIHADYAASGATVHTACTFRTRPAAGADWMELARRAVALCRQSVPAHHRVAGSIAPLADCYRPDLSPPDPGPEHAALAAVLADAGADLLLCETFPHPPEAVAAVEAAVATGVETWAALTAGPEARLLDPEALADAGRQVADAGAAVVLVNCVAASRTLPYVEALVRALPDRRVGAYANAGHPDERIGWIPGEPGPARYLQAVRTWMDAGAVVIGGCCGTGPAHIRAIHDVLT